MPPRTKKRPARRRTRGSGGVYQRKDGLWVGALHKGYDANGKRHREIVYGRTEKIAEEKLLEARNSFRLSGAQALGTSSETTGAYLTRWLEASVAMDPGTYHFRRVKVALIAKTPLWRIPLRKLSRDDVMTMVNTSLPGLKPPVVQVTPSWQTRKHAKDVLRAALNELVKSDKLGRNSAAGRLEIVGAKKYRPKIMTLEEASDFITESMKCEFFALFIMAILAGLRQGELLGLKWSDLNLSKGTVSVHQQLQRKRGRGLQKAAEDAKYLALNGKKKPRGRAGTPARTVGENLELVDLKTEGSHRTFVLPKRVVTALLTHVSKQAALKRKSKNSHSWNPENLVFPSETGGKMQPTLLVTAHFHPTLINAHLPLSRTGSKGFRFHDLRHTAATLMLLQQVPHKVVMHRMGWTTMAMVDRYQHLLPQMDDKAATQLDELFP